MAHPLYWLMLVLGGLALPNAVHALLLAVDNPSFEMPATGPGTFVTDAPPSGWSAYGSIDFSARAVGVLNPADTSLYTDPAPDDDNVGVVFLLPSASTESGLQQTLTATLQAATQYTLTVAVGNIANDPNPPHSFFDFSGFPGYRIDLLAGSAVLASDHNSLAPAEGRFLRSTIQFTTGAAHPNLGQPLGIRLVNLDGPAGIEVNFDDVELDALAAATPTATATPVPEECPETPLPDCKAAASGRGKLTLVRNPARPERNGVTWSWQGGSTTAGELGSPLAGSIYRVCGYDGEDAAIFELTAASAGSCDGRPCWSAKRSGFAYRDRARSAGGLAGLALKFDDSRSSMKLKAKGANLSLPLALPLVQAPNPVRVMMLNEETGICWTTSFSGVIGDAASTTKWKARSD